MRPALLLTVAIMIVAWVVAPAALAGGHFDGKWQVDRETPSGRCDRYNTFFLTIRDGVIAGVSSGSSAGRYEHKGRVSEDGSFSGEFGGTRGQGTFSGQLSDDKGAGQWTAPGGWGAGVMSLRRAQSS